MMTQDWYLLLRCLNYAPQNCIVAHSHFGQAEASVIVHLRESCIDVCNEQANSSSKGTSVCQATAIGAVVILLYTSRACYNLVVVVLSPQDRPSPFNYGWYSVSDQVLSPLFVVTEQVCM